MVDEQKCKESKSITSHCWSQILHGSTMVYIKNAKNELSKSGLPSGTRLKKETKKKIEMEQIPKDSKKKIKRKLVEDECVNDYSRISTEIILSSSKKPKKKKPRKDIPIVQEESKPVCYNSDGHSLVEWSSKSDDNTDTCMTTKKKKNSTDTEADVNTTTFPTYDVVESSVKVKTKKKKRKDKILEENKNDFPPKEKRNPLQTEGSSKKKKLKELKITAESQHRIPEAGDGNLQVDEVLEREEKKKKKKKKKGKHSDNVKDCELTFASQSDTDEHRGKSHCLNETNDASTDTKLDKKLIPALLFEDLHFPDAGQNSFNENSTGDINSPKKKKKHKHTKDKALEISKLSSCDSARKRKIEGDGDKQRVKKMKNSADQVKSNIKECVSSTSTVEEGGLDEIHIDQAQRLALQGEIDRESGRTTKPQVKYCTKPKPTERGSSSSQDTSLIPFHDQKCPVSVEGNEQQMLVQSLRRTMGLLRTHMDRFWVELDQILESMSSGVTSENSFETVKHFTEFLSSSDMLQDLHSMTLMDSQIERTAESTPLSLGRHLTAAGPTAKCFGPLPDVELLNVSEDREKVLLTMSHGRPERFAVLLFEELVPLAKYMEWNQLVNWDGSRGKMAIPANLHTKVLETVGRYFKIDRAVVKDIKKKVNELLRKPRKRNVSAFLRNIQEHIQSFQISVPETVQPS
ncbi:lysine-rich nucleolar protein 1 isoform X2 [Protopterus annectens]|nr:lysine-rich nucleolar protein 1 isoform X2 [Protopterus annectens]